MITIKQVAKSKTIMTNIMLALFSILAQLGLDIDQETKTSIITLVFLIANIVLRFITKEPLSDK